MYSISSYASCFSNYFLHNPYLNEKQYNHQKTVTHIDCEMIHHFRKKGFFQTEEAATWIENSCISKLFGKALWNSFLFILYKECIIESGNLLEFSEDGSHWSGSLDSKKKLSSEWDLFSLQTFPSVV